MRTRRQLCLFLECRATRQRHPSDERDGITRAAFSIRRSALLHLRPHTRTRRASTSTSIGTLSVAVNILVPRQNVLVVVLREELLRIVRMRDGTPPARRVNIARTRAPGATSARGAVRQRDGAADSERVVDDGFRGRGYGGQAGRARDGARAGGNVWFRLSAEEVGYGPVSAAQADASGVL